MSGFNGTLGNWCVGMDGEILSDAGYIVMAADLVHGNESDLELIASAPELLEALQICAGYLGELGHSSAIYMALMDKVNDVIKKALGQ